MNRTWRLIWENTQNNAGARVVFVVTGVSWNYFVLSVCQSGGWLSHLCAEVTLGWRRTEMRAGTELFKECYIESSQERSFSMDFHFCCHDSSTTCLNFTPKTDTPCFSLAMEWDCHSLSCSTLLIPVGSVQKHTALCILHPLCCPMLPSQPGLSCWVLSVPSCIAVVAQRGSATWAVPSYSCFPWKNPTLTSSQSTKRWVGFCSTPEQERAKAQTYWLKSKFVELEVIHRAFHIIRLNFSFGFAVYFLVPSVPCRKWNRRQMCWIFFPSWSPWPWLTGLCLRKGWKPLCLMSRLMPNTNVIWSSG